MPKLMTVDEAAKYLGIPVHHIYQAVRAKPGNPFHLRHVRLGKRFYFQAEWLDEWTERVASEPPASVLRLERRAE
ncbi:helix-turn-helix domain-containing protein [Thermus neutrinimicus]|uniref:helix-turn-helix domain-containing protein n=1 Tax=Thermus neutrinimicus TaxID=2908149 RepID=UPI001FA97D3B|nr:helix-turn-helix domain-containing protein [Thermus neutrinimicus]